MSFSLSILPSPYRSRYLVGATSATVLYRFFQNITGVLVKVWRYACGLDIILRLFFVTFFVKLNLAIFWALPITKWMDRGYFVGATPPTVLYQFFRISIGVLVMVWRYACGLDIILRLFLLLFLQVELSHFSGIIHSKVNGQGIPYGCNSSYSFLPILSKLHLCFGHGLKICMWFGYNPHIIFVTFSKVELSFFSDNFYNKVNGQKIPCGGNSSYSFIPILLKLHWCFGHGLKICMWFGYNPQIIFII